MPAHSVLTLVCDNYARADSGNANHGDCVTDYAAGNYDTKVVWTKFTWRNRTALQIDASEHPRPCGERQWEVWPTC